MPRKGCRKLLATCGRPESTCDRAVTACGVGPLACIVVVGAASLAGGPSHAARCAACRHGLACERFIRDCWPTPRRVSARPPWCCSPIRRSRCRLRDDGRRRTRPVCPPWCSPRTRRGARRPCAGWLEAARGPRTGRSGRPYARESTAISTSLIAGGGAVIPARSSPTHRCAGLMNRRPGRRPWRRG